jgi:2-hydroxycyclohexanecarboxyl-CoA dehydrogenase
VLHLHHAELPGMATCRSGRIINVVFDAARVGSSNDANFVTGQIVSVSGGLRMNR